MDHLLFSRSTCISESVCEFRASHPGGLVEERSRSEERGVSGEAFEEEEGVGLVEAGRVAAQPGLGHSGRLRTGWRS